MIEIEVKSGPAPEALAELIAATLHGHPGEHADTSVATTGKLVREQQEQAELARPSVHDMETVNFQTLDDEVDWTEV
jgi:hypothetical protein